MQMLLGRPERTHGLYAEHVVPRLVTWPAAPSPPNHCANGSVTG